MKELIPSILNANTSLKQEKTQLLPLPLRRVLVPLFSDLMPSRAISLAHCPVHQEAMCLVTHSVALGDPSLLHDHQFILKALKAALCASPIGPILQV